MHVTVQIRVDMLSTEQTLACLKDAFTNELSVPEAIRQSTAFDADQSLPPPIAYACYSTVESLALFTPLGGGMVEYVLEFIRPSNDTLRTLTEHTLGKIERQVRHAGGKFQFVKARLQDKSSLGTAVEARPLQWRNRFLNSVWRRDLINKVFIVLALGVLAWISMDVTKVLPVAVVGVGVSLAVSLVQAALPRHDIEWSVR